MLTASLTERLRDAGECVAVLSKINQDKQHRQTAAQELMMAAERGCILTLAEIAMRQALAQRRQQPAPAPRKKAAKKYRIVS